MGIFVIKIDIDVGISEGGKAVFTKGCRDKAEPNERLVFGKAQLQLHIRLQIDALKVAAGQQNREGRAITGLTAAPNSVIKRASLCEQG